MQSQVPISDCPKPGTEQRVCLHPLLHGRMLLHDKRAVHKDRLAIPPVPSLLAARLTYPPVHTRSSSQEGSALTTNNPFYGAGTDARQFAYIGRHRSYSPGQCSRHCFTNQWHSNPVIQKAPALMSVQLINALPGAQQQGVAVSPAEHDLMVTLRTTMQAQQPLLAVPASATVQHPVGSGCRARA